MTPRTSQQHETEIYEPEGGQLMTTDTTPKPEGHRWLFFAAVLVVFLVLSMLGNAAHVWADWHADVAAGVDRGRFGPWVPTIAIGVAPSAAMVMCEMVVISYRRNSGAARVFVTLASALVGVIALVVSYVGLVYVWATVIGLPTVLAYVAPLVIDVPIIAATVGMWDVLYRIRCDREAEEQAAESDDTEQQRPTEAATEAVAERVDERLQAAVSQSVIAEQRVSSELSVGHAQAVQPSVEASVGPFAEGSPSGELDAVTEHVPEAADTAEQPVTCDVEFAEQVRVESRTKADTETVARVVGLWQQGAGVRAIGREVSMSPSTVSSVTKTAARLLAASDDEGETVRQLSVVGD